MANQNGKGDTYRPVDRKKYDSNYDRIFGKKRDTAASQRKGIAPDRPK